MILMDESPPIDTYVESLKHIMTLDQALLYVWNSYTNVHNLCTIGIAPVPDINFVI